MSSWRFVRAQRLWQNGNPKKCDQRSKKLKVLSKKKVIFYIEASQLNVYREVAVVGDEVWPWVRIKQILFSNLHKRCVILCEGVLDIFISPFTLSASTEAKKMPRRNIVVEKVPMMALSLCTIIYHISNVEAPTCISETMLEREEGGVSMLNISTTNPLTGPIQL